MKYLDIINNFQINLSKKPELMPSSVKTYVKQIREMVNRYGIDPNIQEMNEFIAEKCKKRQPQVKYAIKHYLIFRWRPKSLYLELIHTKIRPPIRKRNYLSRTQAKDIIDSMDNEEHKLISKIQYFTGARASEIISIKKDRILYETEFNRIKIDIIGKGGKIDPIYLGDNLWIELQPYMRNDGEYLFLKNCDNLDETKLRDKTETYYKRYYESLKEAGHTIGLDIATHDWRRSFAQSIKQDGAGIEDVKRALRHSRLETTERYFKNDPEDIAKTMLRHQQGI